MSVLPMSSPNKSGNFPKNSILIASKLSQKAESTVQERGANVARLHSFGLDRLEVKNV